MQFDEIKDKEKVGIDTAYINKEEFDMKKQFLIN